MKLSTKEQKKCLCLFQSFIKGKPSSVQKEKCGRMINSKSAAVLVCLHSNHAWYYKLTNDQFYLKRRFCVYFIIFMVIFNKAIYFIYLTLVLGALFLLIRSGLIRTLANLYFLLVFQFFTNSGKGFNT